MKRLTARFSSKNDIHLTPEQKLNQYVAPPPPPQILEKRAPAKSKQEIEIDEELELKKLNASPEYVRRVRELIRDKYRLDVYVWSMKDTIESNRRLIMRYCKRSDEILTEIWAIVSKWERDLFTGEEWKLVRQIQMGVKQCTQEVPWQSVPPWNRVSSGRVGVGAW